MADRSFSVSHQVFLMNKIISIYCSSDSCCLTFWYTWKTRANKVRDSTFPYKRDLSSSKDRWTNRIQLLRFEKALVPFRNEGYFYLWLFSNFLYNHFINSTTPAIKPTLITETATVVNIRGSSRLFNYGYIIHLFYKISIAFWKIQLKIQYKDEYEALPRRIHRLFCKAPAHPLR